MSSPPIPDADARARALKVDQSFIVQAPAGSGKTELLTQRYLRLLSQVEHPEEIYAITFTRKAAGEMRLRILQALDAARGPAPAQAHSRLTWSLARAALAQDTEHDWQLVRVPNRLRIVTFDSLSHALARQMPLLSELGSVPSTTDQALRYYQDAARATLRALDDDVIGPDVERLLRHLDNRQAQLEQLLCNMLARRDQWLAHAVRSPDGAQIDDALEQAVTEHLSGLAEGTPADWLQSLIGCAQQAAANLQTAGKPSGSRDLILRWHERTRPPGADWAALADWRGLAELLLTAGGEVRKRWDANTGFAAPSEAGLTQQEKTRRKLAKASIAALAEQLRQDTLLTARWRMLRTLPAHGLDGAQRPLLRSLLRVLLRAASELLLVFQEHGEVDFAEVQGRAQRALGDAENPTDLALSLDYRLRHLLVDEFQDTSSSQYALLATLTAGWQPGDGRSLFAVGDPMQSIYRFREAEVGHYLAARRNGIGQLHLTPLTLEVNFRSTQSIVDWVNHCFAQVFPGTVDVARGAVPYAPSVAFDVTQDSKAVEVHALAGADDSREATRVVELVRRALHETARGQVAVLARARAHLRVIASALKEAGLAFQAVDVDPLGSQPVIKDLHALTRALLHPADRLSWMVVLRSPWLGLDMQDLMQLAEGRTRTLPGMLADDTILATLSADGRQRLLRLREILAAELPARGRRRLRQWVESIWLRLGGLAVYGAQAATDAQAFFAALDQLEEAGGLSDLSHLQIAIDDLYAAPDSLADGRLQLMTMHKAKGLEFDTVILPGLGRRPPPAAAELLYWTERTSSDGQTRLLMAPIRSAEQESEPISDYLRELEKDKNQLEVSRLLYVAVTRAKRRLHLLGHIGFDARGRAGRPAAGSLLEKLWPVVEPHFADLQAPLQTVASDPTYRLKDIPRLAADWRIDLPSGAAPADNAADDRLGIEFDWAGDTARHVGTLVHRYLERIASEGLLAWPTSRIERLGAALQRGLQNLGVEPLELEQATDKALRALRHTVADETGRWILAPHAHARCEWPLTLHDETPRHFVIDRTFVDEHDVRWIIDYKTGDHLQQDLDAFLDSELERYREQLETYGRIIRLIEPRAIRLALYFPMFPAWRTWQFDG